MIIVTDELMVTTETTSMSAKEQLFQRIENALDTIRPHLKADGGNIKIVDVTPDNVLKVKLLGSCENCPMSFMTMKAGVEQSVKMAVPEIMAVETVS